MKVAKVINPFEMKIEEAPMPVRGKDEALLRVKYVGICGSDVAIYKGTQPFGSYPRIPGHEFSAEIVEIDENPKGLKKGMIVTATPYFNCAKCYACKCGKTNCCEDNQTMGVQRDGAFAEYCVVPVSKLYHAKGISDDYLTLIEPFCISYHAVKRANLKKEDTVLIFGAGPIGTFAAVAAKQLGCRVIISDLLESRLKLAGEICGVETATPDELDKLLSAVNNGGGADVCIEAVGVSNTFLSCIDRVCFGGKIILIGNGKTETTFNHSIILKKELQIFGSRNSLFEFEDAINMMSEGSLNLEKIVTHVLPFEKVQEAFDILANNDGTASKVLVKIS